jgi:hypothetical protein
MPHKKQQPAAKWSMHPSLHYAVSTLLREHDISFEFNEKDDSENCVEEYDTKIIGRFRCHNPTCEAGGWRSKQVAITIRMYTENRYNARVYHQRCQTCSKLSRPKLDGSYADRVAYRLKKWSGVEMDPPPYSGESNGPHMDTLCEGCKHGHCTAQLRGVGFGKTTWKRATEDSTSM